LLSIRFVLTFDSGWQDAGFGIHGTLNTMYQQPSTEAQQRRFLEQRRLHEALDQQAPSHLRHTFTTFMCGSTAANSQPMLEYRYVDM